MSTPHLGSDFREGDRVTVGEGIVVGAPVYFERTGPTDVVVRPLAETQLATIHGPVYRALPGHKPGLVRFVLMDPSA